MANKKEYSRNRMIWLVSLLVVFILLIILGAFLQYKNISADFVLPFFFGSALAIFFVLAYYGIKRKISFPEQYLDLGFIFITLFILWQAGIKITLIVGTIVAIIYLAIFKKVGSLKSFIKEKGDTAYAQTVGKFMLILGILLTLFFAYMIIKNPLV